MALTRKSSSPIPSLALKLRSHLTGMSQSLIYEAEARVSFNASCPLLSTNLKPESTTVCNITNGSFPAAVRATWRPPVHSTGLIPRPVAARAHSDHPSTAPSKDCTDMSFTHPDLVIDDFYYVPSASSSEWNMTAQDFNFTMTNYATGTRSLCQTKHAFSHVQRGVDVDCSTILTPQNDAFLSHSTPRDGLFLLDSHELWVGEAWTCSDASGNHSYADCNISPDNPVADSALHLGLRSKPKDM